MTIGQTASPRQQRTRVRPAALAEKAKESLFQIVVVLGLTAPSLTNGPLTWLPFVRLSTIEDGPVRLGPLALLPPLALLAWALARITAPPRRRWRWGRLHVTLPLLGLTTLTLLGLEPTASRRTAVTALSLGLIWWVYLYVVNETPDLSIPLALVILIQSGIAVGQFALQKDLGLQALGELALDPEQSGTCVLFAREQRWLRAYGLSGHPNVLGALLSVLLLLSIGDIARARGRRRICLTVVGSAGILGLLTTFSRSAWLAFGVGLLCWLTRKMIAGRQSPRRPEESFLHRLRRTLRRSAQFAVPAILAILFLLCFHDLVASRFLHLETPIEARSIQDRRTDAELALLLIRRYPWFGVGVRNYLPAVRAIEPDSRTVHNVPLLVAAELGLSGATLWLWLALSGLAQPWSRAWPPWVAMLISNLFDIALLPTNGWYAALAFGLLAAYSSLPLGAAAASQPMFHARLRDD